MIILSAQWQSNGDAAGAELRTHHPRNTKGAFGLKPKKRGLRAYSGSL